MSSNIEHRMEIEDKRLDDKALQESAKEYRNASIALSVVHLLILGITSELIRTEKEATSYDVGYIICLAQLISMLFYIWKEDLYPFDVPIQGRQLLATRSVIYCFSFLFFMRSIEWLNPLIALMAH